MKASMAREVLARCAFNDSINTAEDSRVLDATKRAIQACFPADEAEEYVAVLEKWAHDAGVR